jgi:hypothetical protein
MQRGPYQPRNYAVPKRFDLSVLEHPVGQIRTGPMDERKGG